MYAHELDFTFITTSIQDIKGIKCIVSDYQQKNSDGGNMEVGKHAITLELLHFLVKKLVVHNTRGSLFLRVYMLLQWNLMSCTNNKQSMKLKYLILRNDAIGIVFLI